MWLRSAYSKRRLSRCGGIKPGKINASKVSHVGEEAPGFILSSPLPVHLCAPEKGETQPKVEGGELVAVVIVSAEILPSKDGDEIGEADVRPAFPPEDDRPRAAQFQPGERFHSKSQPGKIGMGHGPVVLQTAPEDIEAKGAEVFQNPGKKYGRGVCDPQHVEGMGIVGENQRAMAPLPPPQGLSAEGDFHRAKPEGRSSLQKPERSCPISPGLQSRAGLQQEKSAKASLGGEDQLPVVVIGVVDAVIVVVEGKLAGVSSRKGGRLSVPEDIFDLEFPQWLDVAGGSDALKGTQFNQLIMQIVRQLTEQLPDGRGGHLLA